MGKRRILWHILPYYVLIILLSLVSVSWYASKVVRDFHKRDVSRSLEERARTVEVHLSGLFGSIGEAEIDSICDRYGLLSEMRITIIALDGSVLGDSEEDPARMENHRDRPEIRAALGGTRGISERHSGTLNQNFLYVAVPLRIDGRLAGIIRASIPLTEVEGSLSVMYRRLILSGILAALVAVLLSLVVSRRISDPLEEMRKGIGHFQEEDLEYRIPVHGLAEVGDLARAINDLAADLRGRIDTVEEQKNEQEAVFSAIPEAILMVDDGERIVRMNPGAARLLGISPDAGTGRSIQEVVRSRQLQRFVKEVLSSVTPVEADLSLRVGYEDVFLQARGVTLGRPGESGAGAVIVLSNVTRIKRLENLRREFVANVSHELRTPVTAVKGFVETLEDGAIEDQADARKFLAIIGRQVDRMNSIITDLLMLAQVEGGEGSGSIRFERVRVRDVLDEARQVCHTRADEKKVRLDIECPEDLECVASPALLEQAVINLVDNAIKYSGEG
ncbi:MAG TPA: histidine kinase dimerization/phospho-acceptor domain-containing protein, partial [Candidatus Krumholzibacterium sp.]|nr:histidine kinase dimerization/phospho-acceptor domain-containing protein [Candidatus Krumholzibacterium sp.]